MDLFDELKHSGEKPYKCDLCDYSAKHHQFLTITDLDLITCTEFEFLPNCARFP